MGGNRRQDPCCFTATLGCLRVFDFSACSHSKSSRAALSLELTTQAPLLVVRLSRKDHEAFPGMVQTAQIFYFPLFLIKTKYMQFQPSKPGEPYLFFLSTNARRAHLFTHTNNGSTSMVFFLCQEKGKRNIPLSVACSFVGHRPLAQRSPTVY